jgi:hypothetical protein
MRGRFQPWPLALALAAPLLILLALLMALQRHGLDRLQVLPALLIGGSLMAYSVVARQRRRRALLLALRRDTLQTSPPASIYPTSSTSPLPRSR